MRRRKQRGLTVGIDLGARSVKVAIAEHGTVTRVASYEDLREPDPFAGENEALINWVALYVKENGLVGAPTVIGMPGDRFILVPVSAVRALADDDLLDDLRASTTFRDFLPFDDPVLQSLETVPGRSRQGSERRVWVASASRATIEARMAAIASTRLEPAVVEPDLAGLARILSREGIGRVVVDIGEISTQIGFIAAGRLLFLHHVGVGVLSLLDPVAKEIGCSVEEAFDKTRNLRRGSPDEHADLIEDCAEPIVRRLAGELGRCTALHAAGCGLPERRAMTLLGGGAMIFRPEDLAVPGCGEVRSLEADPDIVGSPVMQSSNLEAESIERFAAVLGSALRRRGESESPNFARFRVQRRRRRPLDRVTRKVAVAAAAIIAVTLALHALLFFGGHTHARELERISSEIDDLKRIEQRADVARSSRDDSASILAVANEVRAGNRVHPDVVLEIGRLAGQGVAITRIVVKASELTVHGRSARSGDVLALLDRLRTSPRLEAPTVRWIRAVETRGRRRTVVFEIGARVPPVAREEESSRS